MDFSHLFDLFRHGIWWVTRAKDNLQYRVVKRRLKQPEGNIPRDDQIVLKGPSSRAEYPARPRPIVACVEVAGLGVGMLFLTDKFSVGRF